MPDHLNQLPHPAVAVRRLSVVSRTCGVAIPEDPSHLPPTDENLKKLVLALIGRFPAEHGEIQATVHRHFEEVSTDASADACLLQLTEGSADRCYFTSI
ncbi:hypothetical protein BKN51_16185 [Amycolatopsis sp. BJA-103]|nr:hypothetical protein BKN51_16185 [Amycolatopsis sp. BJA-103]